MREASSNWLWARRRSSISRLNASLAPELAGPLLHPLLMPGDRSDVINPKYALAANKTNMTAAIGDLRIRQENVKTLASLCVPDHPLIEQLAATFAKQCDDSRPLIEVVPEPARIKADKLVFLITQQVAQLSVVKEEVPVLIHDQ